MRWLGGITVSVDMSLSKLEYSCRENPMDRGTWRSTVHGVAESVTTYHTCMNAHRFIYSLYDGIYDSINIQLKYVKII